MSERPAPTEQALLDHASPDQGGPVVEATAVSKEFPRGNVLAIDSMSFAMGEHTFTSVVGPSGCGKSTILRLVAGLIPISSGDLRVRGSAVSGPRADTSMMFQRPVLLLWKTAMENVLLPEKLQGRVTAATRRRAGEIFELVGLAGFENAYPQHLSGGMQQRAALARVLMTGADLLLMDEPFASLDEFTRERLNLELLRIQAEFRASVMFVTHNITEAVFLADRVLVMTPRPGRLAGIVEVPFDRPRRIDLLKTPEFNELAFQVRAMLGEHV